MIHHRFSQICGVSVSISIITLRKQNLTSVDRRGSYAFLSNSVTIDDFYWYNSGNRCSIAYHYRTMFPFFLFLSFQPVVRDFKCIPKPGLAEKIIVLLIVGDVHTGCVFFHWFNQLREQIAGLIFFHTNTDQ